MEESKGSRYEDRYSYGDYTADSSSSYANAPVDMDVDNPDLLFSYMVQNGMDPRSSFDLPDITQSAGHAQTQRPAWPHSAAASRQQQSFHNIQTATNSVNQRFTNAPLPSSDYYIDIHGSLISNNYLNPVQDEPWIPPIATAGGPVPSQQQYLNGMNQLPYLATPSLTRSQPSDARSAHSDHYCDPCDKGFSTKKALDRHQAETKIHQQPGEQPYVCRCGKEDLRVDNFTKRHLENCRKTDSHPHDTFYVCKCGHRDQNAAAMREHLQKCPLKRSPGRPHAPLPTQSPSPGFFS